MKTAKLYPTFSHVKQTNFTNQRIHTYTLKVEENFHKRIFANVRQPLRARLPAMNTRVFLNRGVETAIWE